MNIFFIGLDLSSASLEDTSLLDAVFNDANLSVREILTIAPCLGTIHTYMHTLIHSLLIVRGHTSRPLLKKLSHCKALTSQML